MAIVLLLVAIDQITKSLIVSSLSDGRIIQIFWTLQFSLGYNSGFAFSMGQGLGPLIGVVATLAVLLLTRAMLRAESSLAAYGLCLITGGAAGNIADRLFRGNGWLHGRVVDFIDFQWFPSFNIADAAITIGATLLMFSLFAEYRASGSQEAL